VRGDHDRDLVESSLECATRNLYQPVSEQQQCCPGDKHLLSLAAFGWGRRADGRGQTVRQRSHLANGLLNDWRQMTGIGDARSRLPSSLGGSSSPTEDGDEGRDCERVHQAVQPAENSSGLTALEGVGTKGGAYL
jgi:hypothetical protein